MRRRRILAWRAARRPSRFGKQTGLRTIAIEYLLANGGRDNTPIGPKQFETVVLGRVVTSRNLDAAGGRMFSNENPGGRCGSHACVNHIASGGKQSIPNGSGQCGTGRTAVLTDHERAILQTGCKCLNVADCDLGRECLANNPPQPRYTDNQFGHIVLHSICFTRPTSRQFSSRQYTCLSVRLQTTSSQRIGTLFARRCARHNATCFIAH